MIRYFLFYFNLIIILFQIFSIISTDDNFVKTIIKKNLKRFAKEVQRRVIHPKL